MCDLITAESAFLVLSFTLFCCFSVFFVVFESLAPGYVCTKYSFREDVCVCSSLETVFSNRRHAAHPVSRPNSSVLERNKLCRTGYILLMLICVYTLSIYPRASLSPAAFGDEIREEKKFWMSQLTFVNSSVDVCVMYLSVQE